MKCRYLLKAHRFNGEPVYFRHHETGLTGGEFLPSISLAKDFGSQKAVLEAIPALRARWRGLNTFTVAIDSAN